MIYKPKWKRRDGTVVECSRYWIQYCRDGEVFRKSTECERHEDAKRILREHEGDVARGAPVVPRMEKTTVSELLDDLVTEYQVTDRASIQKIEGICQNHLNPFFGRPERGR